MVSISLDRASVPSIGNIQMNIWAMPIIANSKFRKRVEYIEANADRKMSEMTLGEMDELWEESKRVLSIAK